MEREKACATVTYLKIVYKSNRKFRVQLFYLPKGVVCGLGEV